MFYTRYMRYSLDCDICPIAQDPDPLDDGLRIVDGNYWIANTRLNDQEYLGTAYITLRDHKESLASLSKAEDDEFITIRNALITAQHRAFGAEVINLSCLMNNTFQQELASPHVHYHAKPRYNKPVEFAGQWFVDRQFGHYIKDKHPNPVSEQVGRLITNRLRDELAI